MGDMEKLGLKFVRPSKNTGRCLPLTKEEKERHKKMAPYYKKRKILLAREYADCIEKGIRMKHKNYKELKGYFGVTFNL